MINFIKLVYINGTWWHFAWEHTTVVKGTQSGKRLWFVLLSTPSSYVHQQVIWPLGVVLSSPVRHGLNISLIRHLSSNACEVLSIVSLVYKGLINGGSYCYYCYSHACWNIAVVGTSLVVQWLRICLLGQGM